MISPIVSFLLLAFAVLSISGGIVPGHFPANVRLSLGRPKRAVAPWPSPFSPTFCLPSGLPGLMSSLFQRENKLLILSANILKDKGDGTTVIVQIVPNTAEMVKLGWLSKIDQMEELYKMEESMKQNKGCKHMYTIAGGNSDHGHQQVNHLWHALSKSSPPARCHWVFGWSADLQRHYPHRSQASVYWLQSGPMLEGSQAELWPLCDAEWDQFVEFWKREKQFLHCTIRMNLSWAQECTLVLYDQNLVELSSWMWKALQGGKLIQEIPDAEHGVWAVSRILCGTDAINFDTKFEAMKARNPSWMELADKKRGKQIHSVLVKKLARGLFRTHKLNKEEEGKEKDPTKLKRLLIA